MPKMNTKIEIVVQNPNECAADYRDTLQKMINELQERSTITGSAFCFPTSAADGRLTTMIQWQELEPDVKQKP